jgi:hypothetical protein
MYVIDGTKSMMQLPYLWGLISIKIIQTADIINPGFHTKQGKYLKMKYCPNCYTLVRRIELEGKDRHYCADCKSVYYQQLKVGAGGLIEEGGQLLLVQRRHDPFKDCWNLPVGYAEAGEDTFHTVVSEVYEEIGLKVDVENLFDITSSMTTHAEMV